MYRLAIAAALSALMLARQGTAGQPRELDIVEQPAAACCDAIAISPDGTLLASSWLDRVTLWDLETGLALRTLRPAARTVADRRTFSTPGTFAGLAFDPTGRYVASAAMRLGHPDSFGPPWRDAPPNVWEVESGRDVSAVPWRFDAVRGRITADGFPFDAAEPVFWQMAASPATAARLAAFTEQAQAFSPDGTTGVALLGSGNEPYALRASSLGDGRVLWTTRLPNSPTQILFSPDGRWVIAGGERSIQVLDALTGDALDTELRDYKHVRAMAFTRDAKHLAVAGARFVHVFTSGNWRKQVELPLPEAAAPSDVAFTPDGAAVVAGATGEGLYIWDRASGRQLRSPEIHGPSATEALAISEDGRWIAAGTAQGAAYWEGDVWLWALDGASPPRVLWSESGASIVAVAFSPDDRQLAAASVGERTANRVNGLLSGNVSVCELPECSSQTKLLDPDKSADRRNTLDYPEAAGARVAFTPDGRTLVAGVLGITAYTDEEIRFHEFGPYPRLIFYDTRTLQPRRVSPIGGQQFSALSVSPDGRLVATGHDEDTARLWQVSTGRQQRYFVLPSDALSDGSDIRAVAFDPAGRRLATAGESGVVSVWNIATGARAGSIGAGRPGYGAIAFSPDGSLLVAAECTTWRDERDRVRIMAWDAATLQPRWAAELQAPCVSSLAFEPGGRWLAASSTTGITVHATGDGVRLMNLATAGSGDWLAWTPDGRYAGTPGGIATLAAARTGTRALPLPAVGRAVTLAELFAQALAAGR